jgi:hypothetical protein
MIENTKNTDEILLEIRKELKEIKTNQSMYMITAGLKLLHSDFQQLIKKVDEIAER